MKSVRTGISPVVPNWTEVVVGVGQIVAEIEVGVRSRPPDEGAAHRCC